MYGAKRRAESAFAPDAKDIAHRDKRVMEGAFFDLQSVEPPRTQSSAMFPLDMDRAELSRKHVRALNSQFVSWLEMQLKNHPDELWADGVRDYLAHASTIMLKFSDVVNWIKANAAKGASAATPLMDEKKSIPELKGNESNLFQDKSGIAPSSTSTSFTTSWSSSLFSNNQTSGLSSKSQSSSILLNGHSSGLLSNSSNQSSGLFSNNQISGLVSNSKNQSSELFSNSQSSRLFSNQSSGWFSSTQSSGFTGVFSSSQSSGGLSSTQNSGVFSNSQSPFFLGGQNLSSISTTQNISDGADEENEIQQPGSPSVKKSEEKGIIVVHEAKCKLYLKSTDPADTDPWKDKGTGNLSIKCKEGVSKGTKESQPTITVRNDVGKVLLNAFLYPGIKTNPQKNSLVAIFHTVGDDGSDKAVARTFLIRLKTEDDRNKLATVIQEHAPAS